MPEWQSMHLQAVAASREAGRHDEADEQLHQQHKQVVAERNNRATATAEAWCIDHVQVGLALDLSPQTDKCLL